MTFTFAESDYKLVKQGDSLFTFSPNGITLVQRASIEIDPKTPYEWRLIIQDCINKGYLKPVAAIRGIEATMEYMRK